MAQEVILTGIRANNDLHIGNYFGALLPMVDMAKSRSGEYQINLFIPDLHSFTTPIEHDKLQNQIMHNLKLFVAAGLPLDTPNIYIYRQSYIPAHSELTWILDCFTGFGELARMTQFKQKSFAATHERLLFKILHPVARTYNRSATIEPREARLVLNIYRRLEDVTGEFPKSDKETLDLLRDENHALEPTQAHSLFRLYQDRTANLNNSPASVGLFNYPVLMAADILLYGAKYVPVGDDQTQHLEFTRNIAERMNSQFGELFVVPEAVAKQHEFFGKDQGLRIKDLVDPTKKMSKSTESDKGVIFLGDDPEEAAQKIMNATTDSFTDGIKLDTNERPGVTNLVQIHDLLKPGEHDEIMSLGSYKDLKTKVAGTVRDFLIDFHNSLKIVDDETILRKLEADETAMSHVADITLLKVQQAVGLRPKS